MSSNFGEFFRVLRKNSKFSGEDGAIRLGDAINVSRATIYNWERSAKIPARIDWNKINFVFEDDIRERYINSRNPKTTSTCPESRFNSGLDDKKETKKESIYKRLLEEFCANVPIELITEKIEAMLKNKCDLDIESMRCLLDILEKRKALESKEK